MQRYISIFQEKAISVSDVKANKNFCLDVHEDSINITLILYDKTKVTIKNGEVVFKEDCVYMFGELKRDKKAPLKCWQTSRTAASSGYGAFLYDTMLSMAGSYGLIPDRVSVSKAAKGVWEFYFKKRKDEFDLIKIDDASNPETPDKKDDARVHYPNSPYKRRHWVDHIYYWKNWSSHLSSIKPLIDNSKTFVAKMADKGISKETFLRELFYEGDRFFNVKYYL